MKKYLFVLMILSLMNVSESYAQQAQPGDIIITEFMADPLVVTDANGEWFEILNVSSVPIDINGWRIKDNGANNHLINTSVPLMAMPGVPMILANNADNVANGGITPSYVFAGYNLANAGDEIILTDTGGVVIDIVVYANTTAGKSWSLDVNHYNATDNDNFAFWCLSVLPYGAGDLGTPGAINPACPSVGINSISIDEFSVYTLNGELMVKLNASAIKQQWDIMDVTGKTVLTGTVPEIVSEFSIPVHEFKSGIYLFRLSENSKAIKFIME